MRGCFYHANMYHAPVVHIQLPRRGFLAIYFTLDSPRSQRKAFDAQIAEQQQSRFIEEEWGSCGDNYLVAQRFRAHLSMSDQRESIIFDTLLQLVTEISIIFWTVFVLL